MSVIKRRSDVDEVGDDFGEENVTCLGMIVKDGPQNSTGGSFYEYISKDLTS
jgi:hypothetical protein